MKIKNLLAFVLVAVMVLSLGVSVSAADITLYADQKAYGAHAVTDKATFGVYYEAEETTCAFTLACPSYSNALGTLHFGLYAWQGDYDSTLESGELHGADFKDFRDNADLKFEFPTAPAGEWLVHVSAPAGSDQVGAWSEGNKAAAADEYNVKIFLSGKEQAGRVPRGKLHTGASATLGNLKMGGDDGEEPIDIGTATTSTVPAKTFEEKIAESIIMYTGSSTAYVGAKTKMIDKYNKNVTPVVVNDCTLLPIRFVAENLGTTLVWDDANQIITMERYGTVIEMKVGSDFMKLNGQPVALEVAPTIMNGRTMVPLRAIVHALNIPIHWRADGENGLIIIGETCNDLGEDLTVIGTLLSKLKMR